LRARLVGADRLGRDHGVEPEPIAAQDVLQECVVRIRHDGPWHAVEVRENAGDLGIGLGVPPEALEGVDVWPRI